MLSASAQSFYTRFLPSILLSLVFLLLPLAAILEHSFPKLWQERLLWADLTPAISRHTPIYFNGTFLPPVIKNDLTLAPDRNPVILSGSTHIPSEVTLTITPGTQIYAHEFAALEVSGRLEANGSPTKPIVLTTNEAHPRNQLWNGLIFKAGSMANLSFLKIQHASPAITCLENSRLDASNLNINVASTGIYSLSPNCNFRDSDLTHVRHGIVTSYPLSSLNNVNINASKQDIFNFSF